MTFKHSSKLNLSCSWASFNFPQKWRKWRNMLLQGILSWWVTSHSAELLTFCLLLSFYTDCACYWSDYVLFRPFNGEPLCTQYFPASGRVTSGKDWETLKRKTVKFTPYPFFHKMILYLSIDSFVAKALHLVRQSELWANGRSCLCSRELRSCLRIKTEIGFDSSLQRLSENQRSGPTACFISPSTKFTIPQPYAVWAVLLTFICLLM